MPDQTQEQAEKTEKENYGYVERVSLAWTVDTPAKLASDANAASIEFYKEYGQWARHYSTVRMTIATFFITASFALLHLRWEKPDWLVALVALIVAAIGAFFFVLFTRSTFKRLRDQIGIVNEIRRAHGKDKEDIAKKYQWKWALDGLPAAVVFVVVFVFVLAFWLTRDHPAGTSVEVRVPLALPPGTSRPANVDVPIKVSFP
jgi:hypothetical protein